jgi:hypothetical protein
MIAMKSSPPLEPLAGVVERLEHAGLVVALGGSGLLGALGLADEAHDWDLTTDAAAGEIAPLLAPLELESFGPSGLHADHKLKIVPAAIEIICRMAIRADAGVVRIPTVVSRRTRGIPLGSPEAWAVAYALLGRGGKSEALFGWLEARGADAAIIARLRAEPLPEALASRLAALPGCV